MKKSICAVVGFGLLVTLSCLARAESAPGKVRTYYVAADEVEWDYAPGGVNKMMGMKFEGYSKVFTERGPHRIGTVYRKALYREYTDETFAQLKPRPAQWEHNGLLGPDPACRSWRHDSRGIQKQRQPSLQHASPRRVL